ncbi:MAG TPA: two-component regulator propeller domain-containing protein [Chitinophagaceae bacterium]|nr:two-component regulator propeller domain-containing protein [Chitinophagaceae bacterium]
MKQIACLLCTFFSFLGALAQLPPIGNWREHLSYHQAIAVVAGNNEIFAATTYALFSVELSDNSLHRMSKMTGLSETGINCIALDSVTGKLIIAYTNSNLDLLKNGLVKNIPALKEFTVSGDKSVYSIYCLNGKAYLCTGLGLVVVDIDRNEIKETYVIGQNGQLVKVNGLASDRNFFYAATAEGLKTAAINSTSLADYRTWQSEAGLSPGSVNAVVVLPDERPVVLKNDSLYVKQGANWSLLYAGGFSIQSITKSGNQLILSETGQPAARIVILNTDGNIASIIQNPVFIKNPSQAINFSNDTWIADSTSGLIKFSGNSFTSYTPNSPLSTASGEVQIIQNKLWSAAGSVNADWIGQNNKNGAYLFAGNNWENYNSSNVPAFDSLPDLITLAIDSRINSVWLGSFGGGLIQLKEDKTAVVFKQQSPLQSPPGRPGSYFVSGLALDAENNLWVANYGANQEVHVRKTDGNWRSFSIPFIHSENAVSQIVIDALDQKWIVSPKGNGLFCFNHGASIDNPADDKWRFFRAGLGNGNLPANNVLSIAMDKNGFIWVGTSNGIGIIPCRQQVFSTPSCEAVLPVVQNGNFNSFLFSGEQVQSIAVDGADRKWIGTKNGAWLISADGEKTIYHFTEEKSPLLSNDVRRIAIDGASGEVFFSTDKGICSFRGTATEGSTENRDVLVYPNPVPSGYTGQVAIRGVVENAIVKITELDGRLVYQARANGGQVVWNGRDYKGKRVASGIYLVLITDANRKENLATKIVFLN